MGTTTPVHMNAKPVELYVARAGTAAVLVLTEGGPIQAKEIAEHHLQRPCHAVEPTPAPLICPDARLVDKIVDGAVSVMTRTIESMTLYRFEVDVFNKDQNKPPIKGSCLVWTNTRLKGATQFAAESVKGHGRLTGKVQAVNNPLIVDRSNVESILRAG